MIILGDLYQKSDRWCGVRNVKGKGVNIIYRITLLNFIVVLNRTLPYAPKRGLHDVGHVGAATGRGAKPRQAFLESPVSTLLAAEHKMVHKNTMIYRGSFFLT